MPIIFRPNRGSLVDSMADCIEFESEEQLKSHIVTVFGGYVSIGDILIGDYVFEDDRIGWKDARYVLTKRMGDDDYITLYGTPQSVGTCATIYPKSADDSEFEELSLPIYSLGETFNIISLDEQIISVVVTRRIAEYDFDKGSSSTKFLYDLKHSVQVTKGTPWSWNRVPQADITRMINQYKAHAKE